MPIVSHYEINRGRSSELERTDTGTATITMIDTNGSLDPSGSSTYDPMTPVAIGLQNPVGGGSSPIFRGHVARWSYDLYPTEDYAIATLDCVDSMDVLANAEMTAGPTGYGDVFPASHPSIGNIKYLVADQVAHRINEVLDESGWPAGMREIFSGNVKLQETTYAPRTPALSAILDAADAEFPGVSNFYMQKDGTATFHGRLARFNPTDGQYGIAIWGAGDMAAVAADSSKAVISALDFDRDKDKIINSALATHKGIRDDKIEDQRVQDASSIAAYGTRSASWEDLITLFGHNGNTTPLVETKKFATYYVNNYKNPRTRVNRISFTSRAAGGTNGPIWALLCGVDISDIIRLKTTHHGGAGGFDEDFYVEGLHYSVDPLNDDYLDVTLELDVSPRSYFDSNPF